MTTAILSINAGSSSVKTKLYLSTEDKDRIRPIASAQITGLNDVPAKLTFSRASADKTTSELDKSITTPNKAFKYILDLFTNDADLQSVASRDNLTYACHRVVHGGDYSDKVLITDETYYHIEKLEDLAPLHNASAVEIIHSCLKELPKVKNIAFFDSAFHQTMPACVKTYSINQEIAKERGLRKYGFHGISYQSILRSVSVFLNKSKNETSIIALHLGSGASACAIRNGKSVDTSMGLTPVSGLPGSSRSGDIDPSLVFHYTSEAAALSPSSTKELHITTAEDILNKQSGWKALTGTSDFSKIAHPDANEACRLAFDIFVNRISAYVGSYFIALDGKVDALVFAGGIGERSPYLRMKVVERCKCLGFSIDNARNDEGGGGNVTEISNGTAPKVLVCQTDEEGQMARSCIEDPLT